MTSETKTFRQRVLAASRDELLEMAYETWADSDLRAHELIEYFIRAEYDWKLNDGTGVGRIRTADEIRAALLEEFGDFDDDNPDEPVTEPRHYCDVADPVVRARRVAEWFGLPYAELSQNLFAEPVQLNLFDV